MDNFEVLNKLDEVGYGLETQVHCHLDAEFMSLSIPDGHKTFSVNGDRITPGISVSNSEVGLASLSIAAFFLRLVCTNGMVAKTEVSSSFRHVSTKVLAMFPEILEGVSHRLDDQRDRFRISMESRVEDPKATMASFNRQYQLGKNEQEAAEWGFGFEPGETMFHVINAYTRGAQFKRLSAESAHRLQRVGGEVMAMVG